MICNFRAPDQEHYNDWKKYTAYVKDHGLDVCRVTTGLTNAFMSVDTTKISSTQQIVNISMDNKFLYQVSKPRRIPYSLDCVKKEFVRTISSVLFENYVLQKAGELKSSFCFRDFLELKHTAFRRIVIRLKRKGKIIPHPIRTNPRFYILANRIKDYDTKKILKNP